MNLSIVSQIQFTFSLSALLALGHEGGVFISLKQAGHLTVGQQGVHPLQEAGVHDVGLVQDEADLLVLAARAAQHLPQVFVKVLG